VTANLVILALGLSIQAVSHTAPNAGRPPSRLSTDWVVGDLTGIQWVNEVRLSPNGGRMILVRVMPGSTNVYGERADLYSMDLNHGRWSAPVIVDSGLPTDLQPQWLPDGRRISYLSARSGRREVWIADVATRRTFQVTDSRRSGNGGVITEYAISPVGDVVAYVLTSGDDEEQQKALRKKVVLASEHPRFLGLDGIDGSRVGSAVMVLVTLKSGRTELLTSSLEGASSLCWSEDGKRLTFVPFTRHWGGPHAAAADPVVLTIADRTLRPLLHSPSVDWTPIWSPDGKMVSYISHNLNTERPWSHSRSLYVRSTQGGDPMLVSGSETELWPVPAPIWASDSVIYGTRLQSATARLYAFYLDGRPPAPITPEGMFVRSYSLSRDGRHLAAVMENADTPPEVYIGDPRRRTFDRITDFKSSMSSLNLGTVESVTWRSGDGRFDVQGFLVKPPDFVARRRYPLLVSLHGGPAGLILNSFTDVNLISGAHSPAQLYARRGYLVFLPNFRGDPSYGSEFLLASVRHWGDDVEYDVLPGIDALVARGIADPDRIGLMGFSYGAYAAAWALTRTGRFKAASLSDGPYNLLSYYSQTYLTNDGWLDYYMGGNPSEVQQEYLSRSPLLFAERIRTPTLIRIGQHMFPRADALAAQGLELFRSLHQQGVPVDLVYHPTQGHVIEDGEVYEDWAQRNIAWFDHWLLKAGSPPTTRP
jgi:dipeptidyl aminopeptidase/acylaminoacyl peptidase